MANAEGQSLDTHLLLWSVLEPERLPRAALKLISDRAVAARYSLATVGEIAIKTSLRKPGFDVDPMALRKVLQDEGVLEVTIEPRHIACVAALPPLHRDPFDRMLVAQAMAEGRRCSPQARR